MKKCTHLPIYNNYLVQPNGSCSRFLSSSNLFFFIDNIDHFDEYDFYSKDYFTNRKINNNLNQFFYNRIISNRLSLINELADLNLDDEFTEVDFNLEYTALDLHFDNSIYQCSISFIIEYCFNFIEFHKIVFSFNHETDPMFSIFSYIFVSEYDICNINIKKNINLYLENSSFLTTTKLVSYYLYHNI